MAIDPKIVARPAVVALSTGDRQVKGIIGAGLRPGHDVIKRRIFNEELPCTDCTWNQDMALIEQFLQRLVNQHPIKLGDLVKLKRNGKMQPFKPRKHDLILHQIISALHRS